MIWYPYEQMKTMAPPISITGAKGVYLYTEKGKMIDSVSSWWSVIHGYNHPELNQAMIDQVGRFSHVMLGGLTHEPVQRLAGRLEEFLPGDLNYSFFSDSGSVAVEVALKMALQYYMNRGETERTLTLALEHAYHGDTFKTMETGDDEDYHFVLKAYGPSRHVIHIPTEIPALEQAFEQYHSRLNCLIVEPPGSGRNAHVQPVLFKTRQTAVRSVRRSSDFRRGCHRIWADGKPLCIRSGSAGYPGSRKSADRRLYRPCRHGRQ